MQIKTVKFWGHLSKIVKNILVVFFFFFCKHILSFPWQMYGNRTGWAYALEAVGDLSKVHTPFPFV